VFAKRLSMAKIPQVDFQHILENYARALPHFKVNATRLIRSGRSKYLLRDPHALNTLMSNGFDREKLNDLNTDVPMDYYATLQEHGYDPIHLSEDAAHYNLTENRKLSLPEGLPNFFRSQKSSRFGKDPEHLKGLWVEGGLPQYVTCAKLGAGREDIHKVLDSVPQSASGRDDVMWRNNPLDLNYDRVYHPLGMFGNLLRGKGNADEFAEHVKNSGGDSAYVSGVTTARKAGASKPEATKMVSALSTRPELWKSYFDGTRHKLEHPHLVEAMTKHGVDSLSQYVDYRLNKNLTHGQSMNMLKNSAGYKVLEGDSRTRLIKNDEDYE